MKRAIFFSLLFSGVIVMKTNAQSVAINSSGAIADNSAMVDISSNTKGLLIPRLTSAQRTNIATPAQGLLVYDTDANSFWYYDGGAWVNIINSNTGWLLTGNTGINPSLHFLGTTDTQPLKFKVNNTASGEINMQSNTSLGINSSILSGGSQNTAIGAFSLTSNEGAFNSALGFSSLYSNTTGYSNVAIGTHAAYSAINRNNIVAVGDSALFNNGTNITLIHHATNNTALGSKTLFTNTSGFANTANGARALYSNTTGSGNTASGYRTLHFNTTGIENTATGILAAYSNTTGNCNTSTGVYALYSNTSGNDNTATGAYALYSNTTGYNNVAISKKALRNNITGHDNIAIGINSLYDNTTGILNTSIGNFSQNHNTIGDRNVSLGHSSLESNTTGSDNVGIGNSALSANITGSSNTALGVKALALNSLNDFNVAIGYNASYTSISSNRTTSIGAYAYNLIPSGFECTALGFNAGGGISSNVNNVTCIGANTGWATTTTNTINIGNGSITIISGAVPWSTYSDGRIKNNIKTDVPGLSFINQLRPVTYNLDIVAEESIANEGLDYKKLDKEGNPFLKPLDRNNPKYPEEFEIENIRQTGFIAQEVEAVAKQIGYDFNGINTPKNGKGLYSLSYSSFVVPLVKAVQEQQQQIENLTKKVEELQKFIDKTKTNLK